MVEFQNLGNFLKAKRTEAGYTQQELAGKLGDIHSQFVSNWERGLCAPPGHSFQKLIELLKINREKLVDVMMEDSRNVIEAKVMKKKKVVRKLA